MDRKICFSFRDLCHTSRRCGRCQRGVFFSPLGIIPSERVSGSKNIQRIQAVGRSCSLTLAVTSDLLATVKLDLSCMLNLSATPRRPDLSLAGHGLFNRETSAIAP